VTEWRERVVAERRSAGDDIDERRLAAGTAPI